MTDREGVDLGLLGRSAQARRVGRLTPAALAWAAAAVATVLAFATVTLAALGRDVSAFLLPDILGFTWMGCVLLARRPGHPMGPLLCLIGLATAIADTAFAYERYTLVHSPGSLPFATAVLWVNIWAWAPGFGLVLVLLLVFPDGRLPSRRWRPALWSALASPRLPARSGSRGHASPFDASLRRDDR